jgi:ABC-type lipoprotein release transport system permease subunit
MGADLYTLVGTVDSGDPDLDRNVMAMNLADAQFLFSMPGRYTELVVLTDDFYGAPRFAREVAANIDGEEVEVMPWAELMPEVKQARALDDAGNNIFYLFLVVLLGFEIFNTATVSVMERVREFGVLQSIGMKPGQITTLVFLELVFKVLVALAAGALLLLVLAVLFGDTAIPLSPNVKDMYEDMGFLVESITFSTKSRTFVWPYVAITIVSLLAMIYPILKVRSFSPIKAFRHI